jgi:hypothetical protein
MNAVGIIDTLSSAFDRVTKRPWLALVPMLLNIGIWIGPKLSISELTKQIVLALPSAPELGSQYEQSMEVLIDWLADLGAQANLLSALSMGALGLPSLTSASAPPVTLLSATQRLIEIQTWSTFFGLVALFAVLGLLLGCFCLSLIAQEARDEDLDWGRVLTVTLRSWARLVALSLLVLIIVATAAMGTSIASSLLMLANPGFAWFALNLFSLALVWVLLYAAIVFYFAPKAIILDDTGILLSLWYSFNVVRRNLLPTMGFILLINVIQTGLLYIWRALAVSTVGTLAGIAGNAYISVGLVMASFVFYRDRFVAWQEARAQAKASERRE